MTLTVGSCFAGIGGIDLGLERAGMRVAWQVERDPFCLKVLAKNWPDIRRHDDINNAVEAELAPVDLICGGVPCQPWSVAGKRKGQDDERDLWPAFWRLCLHIRPRFIVVEEVPGFAVPAGLGRTLTDIARAGYSAEWFHLSAEDVGAPHLRERLWTIAYADGSRLAIREGERRDDGEELAPALGSGWLQPEPTVGRVVHGVSRRLAGRRRAAISALGNAVVPQVAEVIGRRILDAVNGEHP